jgi:hypothetical protein
MRFAKMPHPHKQEIRTNARQCLLGPNKIHDGFYLSLEMEAGRRDEDVIADGKAALNRMNAICLVQDERFRPPRVKGITRRDPATVARPRPAVLGFHGRLGVRPALQTIAIAEVRLN